MSRYPVALALLVVSAASGANDQALWSEFGLQQTTVKTGKAEATIYRMKDLTGAIAAWEWQRSPKSQPCTLAPFCSTDGSRTVVADENYLFVFKDVPSKLQYEAVVKTLPPLHDSSLPAILTFVPRGGLVPNSARYILGPESLSAFAPELMGAKPGFDEGAEAQTAEYTSNSGPVHLAVFYYPTPEMARLHAIGFKTLGNVHVKRSSVLVAVVYGSTYGSNIDQQAESLLSRIQYEAKITWNEIPPPSPIKPLYQLLRNIIFFSVALSALCLAAGLIYGALRLYRRRYGTLEEDEAMTTLHLSRE